VNGVGVAEAGFVGTDGEAAPLQDSFYNLFLNSTSLNNVVQDIDTCEVRDPALLTLGSRGQLALNEVELSPDMAGAWSPPPTVAPPTTPGRR
jgi:hypothetical protein